MNRQKRAIRAARGWLAMVAATCAMPLLADQAPPSEGAQQHAAGRLLFIGTQGQAIWAARFDATHGTLTLVGPAADAPRPTWLAVDSTHRRLFAVNETGNAGQEQGGVMSFTIDPASGRLSLISRVHSGGGGATFVSYEPRVATAFVANFGGGQVATLAVDGDGRLSPPVSVQTDSGRGPSPKQDMPHAHAAVLDPSGRYVLVPDMGADRIFIYRFTAGTRQLTLGPIPFVQTPPGTGPRHLAISPDGRFVYVLSELTAGLRTYRWNAARGELTLVDTQDIDPPGAREHSVGEIVIAPGGRHLYLSNRIRHTILAYALDRKSGHATQIQEIATGGNRPRSFVIDPSRRWMIVGNERSASLSVLGVDPETGRLSTHGEPVKGPETPLAFAFFPQ